MTRVLWLSKGLGRGGAEMLLLGLARAMDRHGIEVEVAYRLPHKDSLVPALEAAGVPTHCLADGRLGWLVELRRLLASGHYDVVHTHAPLIGAAARIAAPRGLTVVHTEHNTWDRYHWATRLVNKVTLGRNLIVWGVSSQVAQSIRPMRGFRRPQVAVMLHGVDGASVRRGDQARASARTELGLDETTFVFGTVGNLAPKKDHSTMLRAFAIARSTLPEAQLIIVGTGPREATLRALASSLGISQAVVFTGMRDDVQDLLPAFDLFVLSSLHEGLSIAIIEALAAGVPVVSTGVGGIPELISDGENGVLVQPRNESELARAMVRAASDPELRTRLAAAGLKTAAKFGIQSAADVLADYYRERGSRIPAAVTR